MPIKVIVEFQTTPGMRDELLRALEALIREHAPKMPGYLGSARYTVVDKPDVLFEIAEWESAEARDAHLEEARATNAFATLMPFLDGPIRASVLEPA